MNTKKFALAILFFLFSGIALAQSAIFDSNSPYVMRVGDTVYVTGHFTKWIANVFVGGFVPPASAPTTSKVVLINVTSERQEAPGWAVLYEKYAKARGTDFVVVGRCDLFCARLVMAGNSRTLAPGAYFDLQVPHDSQTKQLEPRYPNTQFAIYEKNPAALAHKDVFFEAFSKGGETGGLRVDAVSARFCMERSESGESGCKDYPLDALQLGLITNAMPATVEIPAAFR